MEFDDPTIPEFASWRSYDLFAQRVRHERRYVWDKATQLFLDTVVATLKGRDVNIPDGKLFYRAQRGIDEQSIYDDEGHEVGVDLFGFGAVRMKPLTSRAKEGRANSVGIPMLYLASKEQTAISEVRPWIGSQVSVAQFKTLRNLRALNLSVEHGQSSIGHLLFSDLQEEPSNAARKERSVWIDIDNAFSQPVTLSDDAADYVPTQILTELFRKLGYDALIYRSQFGEKGFNVVLFDTNDADAINCAPYKVSGIEVKFEEVGGRWFSSKSQKTKKKQKRTAD